MADGNNTTGDRVVETIEDARKRKRAEIAATREEKRRKLFQYEHAHHQPKPPLKPQKKPVISEFRPKMPPQTKDTFSRKIQDHVPDKRCIVYIPDKKTETSNLALCCNIHGIAFTADNKEICAHVLGLMICMLPDWKDNLCDIAMDLGFTIELVRVPSQADSVGLDLDVVVNYDIPTCWIIFGFSILLMFKQCTPENYVTYANARLSALKAYAGYLEKQELPNPFTLKKAQAIRNGLGSLSTLKRMIIEFIVEAQKGRRNTHAVLRYLANILEYNEMNALVFIYETLVATYSPVLRDGRVFTEVVNVHEALKLVSAVSYPQYFKYLAPPEETSKVERNRFRTLAAVARELKIVTYGSKSVKNFISNVNAREKLVQELVKMQNRELMLVRPLAATPYVMEMCAPPLITDGEEVPEQEDEEDQLTE